MDGERGAESLLPRSAADLLGRLHGNRLRVQALEAALWTFGQMSEEERLLVVSQWLLSQENEVDP